jgi:hypothetical protein
MTLGKSNCLRDARNLFLRFIIIFNKFNSHILCIFVACREIDTMIQCVYCWDFWFCWFSEKSDSQSWHGVNFYRGYTHWKAMLIWSEKIFNNFMVIAWESLGFWFSAPFLVVLLYKLVLNQFSIFFMLNFMQKFRKHILSEKVTARK